MGKGKGKRPPLRTIFRTVEGQASVHQVVQDFSQDLYSALREREDAVLPGVEVSIRITGRGGG